ncbi:MAG: hypothetical protein JJU00_18995 [Opitutales bacterium]|nr:hypothetical protein [Opitutales bacterium]
MDNLLFITILTIFVAAFIGTIIKYRLRDRCLRDFREYLVNIEYLDGRREWGKLKVFHNGMELVYPDPKRDPKEGHLETSLLVHTSQQGTIRALKRFHDELSPENQKRRSRELVRTYNPNVFRRTARRMRNTFNLLRDAFGQAVSQMIGAFKTRGTSTLLATQDARINAAAQQVIVQGGSSYEPMLERHIGQYVVLEVTHNNVSRKNVGVLKDYSDSYVTVLNVPVAEEHDFNLAAGEQLRVNRDFDFRVEVREASNPEGHFFDIEVDFINRSRKSVELVRVEGEGYEESLDISVAEGQSTTFTLRNVPGPPFEDHQEDLLAPETESVPNTNACRVPPLRLWIRCRRYMDLIVNRSIGTVRYGAVPGPGSKSYAPNSPPGIGILEFCGNLRLFPDLEGSVFEIFLEKCEVFVQLLSKSRIFYRDVGANGILLIAIEKQKEGIFCDCQEMHDPPGTFGRGRVNFQETGAFREALALDRYSKLSGARTLQGLPMKLWDSGFPKLRLADRL